MSDKTIEARLTDTLNEAVANLGAAKATEKDREREFRDAQRNKNDWENRARRSLRALRTLAGAEHDAISLRPEQINAEIDRMVRQPKGER